MKIINGQIVDTMLGFEDRGILTCMIAIDRSDWGTQGYGNWAFSSYSEEEKSQVVKRKFGLEVIFSILKSVGVQTWEELKGKHCRIKIDNSNRIYAIGNIMRDEWCCIKEIAEHSEL